MTLLQVKTSSHAIQRKSLGEITDSDVSSETIEKKQLCNYDQQGNQIIIFQIALGFTTPTPPTHTHSFSSVFLG